MNRLLISLLLAPLLLTQTTSCPAQAAQKKKVTVVKKHAPKESADLTDLAGRLFPNNPVACINAAAVALSKRDTQQARGYLARFATMAEAGNNMGILFLLEGNRDKAEVYLELAKAAGVKQAEGALEYIRKTR